VRVVMARALGVPVGELLEMSQGLMRLADIRFVYRLAMENAFNRDFVAALLKSAGRDRTRRLEVRGALLAYREAAEAFKRRLRPALEHLRSTE